VFLASLLGLGDEQEGEGAPTVAKILFLKMHSLLSPILCYRQSEGEKVSFLLMGLLELMVVHLLKELFL